MTGSLVLVVGLLLAVLGLVGLVRGRVARLGMRNRAVAAVVAAAGMALALAAGGSASGAPDTLAAPPVRQGPVAANGAVRPAESSASTSPSGPASTSPSGPASSTPPAPVHVPRPSATPGPGTRPIPTVARRAQAGTALAVLEALPSRAGPRDGLRAGAVRPGLGRHRPQRLRHPQRHPAPGPHGIRPQGRHARLPRAARHAARPLHGARASPSCAGSGPRPRCRSTTSSPCRTPGRRAPSSWTSDAATRVRQRPAQPAGGRRPPRTSARATVTPRPGCRREGLPVRLRRPAGRGEGERTACGSPPPSATRCAGCWPAAPAQRLPTRQGRCRSVAAGPQPRPRHPFRHRSRVRPPVGRGPGSAPVPLVDPRFGTLRGRQHGRLRPVPLRRGPGVRLVPRPRPRRRRVRTMTGAAPRP